jgi:phenylacetate-coenzyme A ligase PaaK-like adenylate-forming protein
MKFGLLLKRYLFYKQSQRWSRVQLEAYQDQQLIKIIKHAGKSVPYYRNLFREIGFNPEKFNGRSDLHMIPTLDKETVRTRKRDLIADNAEKYGINNVSTSGTTGTPLHLILDDSTDANFLASLIRCYHWSGYRFFRKTFSLQSYYLKNRDIEYKRLYNVIRFDSCGLRPESAIKAVEMINRKKPSFFMGFPFDLVMMIRFAKEAGLTIHKPKSVLCYGETLLSKKREFLEKELGCPVYDFFSHHECAAMIAECEHGFKHLIEDFAFNEIVDAKGNDCSALGEGELVGTGLYNFAMPLIRYRTGDKVVSENEKIDCECGRRFRRIKEVKGKHTDYLETPDGRVLSTVMSHSIDNAKGVVMSQCIQDAIDHIEVLIVVDDFYNENSEKALINGLRQRIGNEIKLDIRKVTQLEKNSGGKSPFIISRIGHKGL